MRLPRLILPAAAALAICAPTASEAEPPFALEAIDFEPDCAPNTAFNRLLTLLFGLGSFPDNAAAFDEPLHDAVAGDTHHVLRFDSAADWHGLNLIEVRADFGIERGPANIALVFADSPARVREVWNARGWNLPPPGSTRAVDDGISPARIGVGADGARAAVTCFRD
jgi:hypothetical protein